LQRLLFQTGLRIQDGSIPPSRFLKRIPWAN